MALSQRLGRGGRSNYERADLRRQLCFEVRDQASDAQLEFEIARTALVDIVIVLGQVLSDSESADHAVNIHIVRSAGKFL